KAPGEIRIVMLGGSTVYGFDVEVEDALPAQLEHAMAGVTPNVRVVNLGYNDILGDASPNTLQKRHASAIFRSIGYFPILPLVLREKATFLRQSSGAP